MSYVTSMVAKYGVLHKFKQQRINPVKKVLNPHRLATASLIWSHIFSL